MIICITALQTRRNGCRFPRANGVAGRTVTISNLSESIVTSDRLLTRGFLRLWLLSFTTFLSAFQLLPAIPLRILELGGSKASAGLFLAVYAWASALSAPLTGTLADRLGRRRSLLIASLTFIVFSLLYGVIQNFILLLVIGCFHGAVWSWLITASAALMTDHVPESRRTEGIAYWGLASSLAVAIAPSIGLALGRRSWLLLCVEMAILSVMMFVIVLGSEDDTPARADKSEQRIPLVDFRVMIVALTLATASFGYGGLTSYAALLAHDRGIAPESLFFTVFAVSILCLRLFTARLWDRIETRRLLIPCLAIIPPALLLMAVAHSAIAVAVSAAVFGIGLGGAYPAFASWVLKRTEPSRRAATFGSVLWAFDIGIGSGSLVVGALIDRYSYTTAFSVAGAIAALAIPVFLLTSPRLGEDLSGKTRPAASGSAGLS